MTADNITFSIEEISQREADLIALALDTFIHNFNVSPKDEELLHQLYTQFDIISDPDGDMDDADREEIDLDESDDPELDETLHDLLKDTLTSDDFETHERLVEKKENLLIVDFS